MRTLRTLLSLVVLLAPAARAQIPLSNAITIGRTDTIKSAILKEPRPYMVYTPPSYGDTTYAPRSYPVLYLLDGDAHFESVAALIQILGTGVNATFVIPEMIVVAIPNTNRTRDLTPTRVLTDYDGKPDSSYATSGGGSAFLQFIKTELIPHIDSAYRTAPYRVFVGHSLGGITVINTIYTMPDVFNAYIAIDPSLWWDHSRLLKQAKPWATRSRIAERTLFVGQANTINAEDTVVNQHYNAIAQFNGVMAAYHPAGLRYGYSFYPNDSHGSVPLIAEYDGLRFIFASYNTDLFRGLRDPAYLTDHFAKVSKELGFKVTVPEQMLDVLAHYAMRSDTTKAMALMKVGVEAYPKSPHAWVLLGDGWLAKGDTVQAKAAFEKALAARPGYGAAVEQLKKLTGAGR